jgi:hypothetical protein
MGEFAWREPVYFARRWLRKCLPILLKLACYQIFLIAVMFVAAALLYVWFVKSERGIALQWPIVIGYTVMLSCLLFLPVWIGVIRLGFGSRRLQLVRLPEPDFRLNGTSRRAHVLSMRVRRGASGHALLRVRWKRKNGRIVRRHFGIHPDVDLGLLKQFCREWKSV